MPDLAPIEVSMSWHSDGETIMFDGCRMFTPADGVRGQGVVIERIEETPEGIMVHGQMQTWIQPYVDSGATDQAVLAGSIAELAIVGAANQRLSRLGQQPPRARHDQLSIEMIREKVRDQGSTAGLTREERLAYWEDATNSQLMRHRIELHYSPVARQQQSGDEYNQRFDLEPTETCWKDSVHGIECGKASDPASETGLCSDHLREIKYKVKLDG